jgi:hypothetical protein
MPCAAKNYEEYARLCIHLAQQADTQELHDILMRLARIWVRASHREENLGGLRQLSRRPPPNLGRESELALAQLIYEAEAHPHIHQ